MNILFFLKPKSEVAFIYDHSTLRQVLETMEFHKYASIPMLNKAGEKKQKQFLFRTSRERLITRPCQPMRTWKI